MVQHSLRTSFNVTPYLQVNYYSHLIILHLVSLSTRYSDLPVMLFTRIGRHSKRCFPYGVCVFDSVQLKHNQPVDFATLKRNHQNDKTTIAAHCLQRTTKLPRHAHNHKLNLFNLSIKSMKTPYKSYNQAHRNYRTTA